MADYIKVSAKNIDDAVMKALLELKINSSKLEYEVIDKGTPGLLGFIGAKPVVIKARKKLTGIDEGREFLEKIFEKMGMSVTIDISVNEAERVVDINLSGGDMGILIGKRGQTLDSLQYLVSLVINKKGEEFQRVKLDTENYRERRKETLELLAKNIAFKVKRTKHSVALEPMNPYERRIIHSVLQDDHFVVTKSEGEDPFRHVVVMLKKEKRFGETYKKIDRP